MSVGQGIAAAVQCHHRAADAGLAAVLPAVTVHVIEDLADDSAQVEYRISGNLEIDTHRHGYRAAVAAIDRDGEVAVGADSRAGTDDHGVRQAVIAALARVGDAVAVGIRQRQDIAYIKHQRRPRQRIGDDIAIEACRAGQVGKHRRRLVDDAHIGDRARGRILNDDRIGHDVADRGPRRADGLGQ